MLHYKYIKVMINASSLAEVIIDMVVYHYGIPESIIKDQDLFSYQRSGPYYATS